MVTGKRKKKETILVFSAHSDDFVLGAGGTIAKYTQEGKKVVVLIFSYGEKSHPWIKEHLVQKMRSQETLEASKLLHCQALFFNLKEFHFEEDFARKNLQETFLKIIKREKPVKIFTHSDEDPHPDHKAVNAITLKLVDTLNLIDPLPPSPEMYIYSIWNPVSFRTKYPALYVSITKTFSLKLRSLKTFRSQRVHIAYPLLLVLFKAIVSGIKLRTLFAEKFFRLR